MPPGRCRIGPNLSRALMRRPGGRWPAPGLAERPGPRPADQPQQSIAGTPCRA